MRATMKYLCENIQGCVLGFQQSDEITLILVDYKKLNSSAWFDYEVQKMCSIAASMATMAFNAVFYQEVLRWYDQTVANGTFQEQENIKLLKAYQTAAEKGAMFDARCFNIPKEEVTNLLYWRQVDAARNSVQMAARAKFSHNECDNKNQSQLQEMLFQTYGINWNDYPTHMKRGSCCIKKKISEEVFAEEVVPEWGETYMKEIKTARYGWMIDMEIPMFKGEDREYVEQLIQPEE